MSHTCIYKHYSFSRGIFGCFLNSWTCIVIVIMSNKVQLRTVSREFLARSARLGTKAIRETKPKIVENPLLTNRSHFLQRKCRYGFLVRQTPLISAHLVLNSLATSIQQCMCNKTRSLAIFSFSNAFIYFLVCALRFYEIIRDCGSLKHHLSWTIPCRQMQLLSNHLCRTFQLQLFTLSNLCNLVLHGSHADYC